jgi:hypothetical protein
MLQGDSRGRTGCQAMVEIEVTQPRVRVNDKPQNQIGRSRRRENEQQVPGRMADGAGEMGLRVGVDGLMRMHRGVGDLHKEQREAQANGQDRGASATQRVEPGSLGPTP